MQPNSFALKLAWSTPWFCLEGASAWYDHLKNVGELAFKKNGGYGKLTKNGGNSTRWVLWGKNGSMFPELFFMDEIDLKDGQPC